MTKVFHNPRCSKSRAAIELLDRRGINHEVVKYLENPPSEKELGAVVKMLGIEPKQLVRSGEKVFKELGLRDKELTDSQWIATMVKHPALIERPIVIHGKRAAIGRPLENVEAILDE